MQTLSQRFRIGDKAVKTLLGVLVAGFIASMCISRFWPLLQPIGLAMVMFATGMLAAQSAAIWEPTQQAASSPEPSPESPEPTST